MVGKTNKSTRGMMGSTAGLINPNSNSRGSSFLRVPARLRKRLLHTLPLVSVVTNRPSSDARRVLGGRCAFDGTPVRGAVVSRVRARSDPLMKRQPKHCRVARSKICVFVDLIPAPAFAETSLSPNFNTSRSLIHLPASGIWSPTPNPSSFTLIHLAHPLFAWYLDLR